jgi:multiple sugar transport system ATP-binding protein
MRVELVRLHKALGTTSIYVTHDQTEAMTMATKIVLMNDGKIQQAGVPDEFYNKPANIFVAKFIGSPTMNIIDGSMKDGKFVSEDKLVIITPSDKDSELLKPFENKKVSVGIRPERFESGGEFGDTITARIDVVEMLGKEKILHVRLENDRELIISTPGHYEYNEDEVHSFGFDIDSIHFFDTETGERIN